MISAKFVPLKCTLIATAASNLVFSWVVRVGELCHPELPGNAKIVYRPFSHCIDQAGLGVFTAKNGRKHYNPPPLTVM